MVDNRYLKAYNPLLVIHYLIGIAMLDWIDYFPVNFAWIQRFENVYVASFYLKLNDFLNFPADQFLWDASPVYSYGVTEQSNEGASCVCC